MSQEDIGEGSGQDVGMIRERGRIRGRNRKAFLEMFM